MYPIVLCFAACAVLAFFVNLATKHGQQLQVNGAQTKEIMPYAFFAAIGGLTGVFVGVYGMYLVAQLFLPGIP